MGCSGSFFEILELGKVTLLFSELHTISWRQLTLVLLFQSIDSSGLNRFWPRQLKLIVHAALVLNEVEHVSLHKRHAQDLQDLGSPFLIFNQKLGHKVFQFLRVHIRDRPLFVLHDLEDETEKVLA